MQLFKALLPITSFIFLYFSLALILNDFYSVPILPLLLICLGIGLFIRRDLSFETKLKAFSNSAGNDLIVTMLLIFLLSGIFSALGAQTGALSTLIYWVQNVVPPHLFLAGIFVFSCILSMTIGTSVGTIVALAPLLSQIEFAVPSDAYLLLGAIIGGAMFGDNLSFISDTTVAVTKTHEIAMRDKFRSNIGLVLPSALITLAFYIFRPLQEIIIATPASAAFSAENIVLVLPYLMVLLLAFTRMNLLLTLSIGIIGFFVTGIAVGGQTFPQLIQASNQGAIDLSELSLIALLLGGLSGLVILYGGFELLLKKLKGNYQSPKRAGFNIIGLSSAVNTLLANNTLAIIIVGPLAKNISQHNGIPMKRSASLVDTVTCAIQGILPYGAQMLLAVDLSRKTMNTVELIPYVIYPILIGVSSLLFVFFAFKRSK